MKTALITGISKGIGRALAEKFLIEGYRVIGTSTTGAVDFTHPHLVVHQLDLASPESIEKCANDIKRLIEISAAPSQSAPPKEKTEKIGIDFLMNNAGALFDEDETHVVVNKLRQTLEVNLIGTIDFTEQIIPSLSQNAHIVSTSSSAGSLNDTDMEDARTSHFPFHYPAYKISKCALNMYTRTLAMRMQHEDKRNIIVSSVHPGWVKTDMGGEEAPITPEEAASEIFKLATSRPETGQFWFNGKKYPW